jgi:DNA-binding cell septation regulator SpoVG
MSLSTKILFARLAQTGGAKLFFTVAIGVDDVYAVTIRDCVLREGSKGLFVAYPSKPRTKRVKGTVDGVEQNVYVQEVKDDKPVYDNIADLYFDKVEGAEERKATQASWDLKKQITEQAEAMYNKLSGTAGGRGGVAAAAAAPQGYATSTGKTAAASVFDGDDDDDLPF